jgi:hypothetical protein
MLYTVKVVTALHGGPTGRQNVMDAWIDGLGERGQYVGRELRVLLSYLRDLPRDEWVMPMYRQTMQGFPKVGEVRFKCFDTQFRVFGFFGPAHPMYTLLGGATEKMKRYNPADAITSADRMRERVIRGDRQIEDFTITVAEGNHR